MTVETIDGIRVLKLTDRSGYDVRANEMVTMARLYALISGGHALRDLTPTARSLP